jgi:hypothetical protein
VRSSYTGIKEDVRLSGDGAFHVFPRRLMRIRQAAKGISLLGETLLEGSGSLVDTGDHRGAGGAVSTNSTTRSGRSAIPK